MSIYYIDGEEVMTFITSGKEQASGIAYEWEGESVTHLRFEPLRHAFGRCSIVSFALPGGKHDSCAEIKVDISADGTAMIGDIKAEVIPPKENLYKGQKGSLKSARSSTNGY